MGLVLTVIGFFATALIGGGIAYGWQRRSWLFEQRFSYSKEKYEKMIDLNSILFSLVAERVTASRNYIAALQTHNSATINDERARYRLIVNRWNTVFPPAVVRMKGAFTPEVAYSFDHYFPPEFAGVDAVLRRARISVERGNTNISHHINEATGILYLLNSRANEFSTNLLIQAGEERKIIELQPDIKMSNIDNLSYSYLLKSLFYPSALA